MPGQRTSRPGSAGSLDATSAAMASMTASVRSADWNFAGSMAIMIWVRPTSSPKVPIFATEFAPVRIVPIISSRMERPLPFQ